MNRALLNMLSASILLLAVAAPAGEERQLFREEFLTLDAWRPVVFPKIKRHSEYSAVKEGGITYLRTASNASASGIMMKRDFQVFEYPMLRWSWKVDNVSDMGNPLEKSGDDYPVRVYVVFRYDPEKAGLAERIRYGIARRIYGEYPPHSTLSYVWAGRDIGRRIFDNPYSDRAKMVVMEYGKENAGKWLEENVNIVEDYRKAFGAVPPSVAQIAIMNDSDDSGGQGVSYVRFVEVYALDR